MDIFSDKVWHAGKYQYDLMYDRIRRRDLYAAVLELCQPQGFDELFLDVGCGDGLLEDVWPTDNIMGMDPSAEAIAEAQRRHPNKSFVCGGIEKFESNASPFSGVVAVESIEHWADVSEGLFTVKRLLGPNGVFVLTTPNRDSLHVRIGKKAGQGIIGYTCCDHTFEFGFQELVDLVTGHGFVLEQSKGIGLQPYWGLEPTIGANLRHIVNNDEDVNEWLSAIGKQCPPEFGYLQAHRFRVC